jgi:glycosidase
MIVWAEPLRAGASVGVLGSWDDYASAQPLREHDEDWQVLALELPPGEYGYLLVEDGQTRLDPLQPLTLFRPSDQQEVSRVVVDDCEQPSLHIEHVELSEGSLQVAASFLAARDAAPLEPGSIDAGGLALEQTSAQAGTITLSTRGLARGRHEFPISARDEQGRLASARVSVFVDPIAPRWQDAILYQVVTDRFRGAEGAWLDAPAGPALRAGGQLSGIEAAIDEGYFAALGVSALWISPVYDNPEVVHDVYDAYHGYWPTTPHTVESQIGGEAALRSLIDRAHAEGLAVVLDVVPNHVYLDHPIVAAHRSEGWFNEHASECVCGTASCPWDGFAETCWFTPYLPDLRLEHGPAIDWSVADVAWWVENFAVDGVRVDAVPMMPRVASRRIADAVEQLAAGDDRLVLGEVFTGGGAGGIQGLRWYVGPQGLDGVFDFPLMWALRDVLADEGAGFDELDALLAELDAELDGSGALLGRMLSNHDTTRFVSEVVGDAGNDPWSGGASQPDAGLPIERARLALVLQLTLPGVPVLYYGDELGLAGGRDPDSRRVMPNPATLSPSRAALLDHAGRLGRLRRCSSALRSDERETLHVEPDVYAYRRGLAGAPDEVVVVVSRSGEAVELALGLAGRWRDVVRDEVVELAAASALVVPPGDALVLVRDDNECASL